MDIKFENPLSISQDIADRIITAEDTKLKLDAVIEHYRGNMDNLDTFINFAGITDAQKLYVLYSFFSNSSKNSVNRTSHPELLELYRRLKDQHPELKEAGVFRIRRDALDLEKVTSKVREESVDGVRMENILFPFREPVISTVTSSLAVPTVESEGGLTPSFDRRSSKSVEAIVDPIIIPDVEPLVVVHKIEESPSDRQRSDAEIVGEIRDYLDSKISGNEADIAKKKLNVLGDYFKDNLEQLVAADALVREGILNNEELVYILNRYFSDDMESNRVKYPAVVEIYRRYKKNINKKFIRIGGGLNIDALRTHLFENGGLEVGVAVSDMLQHREQKNAEREAFIERNIDELYDIALRTNGLDSRFGRFEIRAMNFIDELFDVDQATRDAGLKMLAKIKAILESINPEIPVDRYRYFVLMLLLNKFDKIDKTPEGMTLISKMLDTNFNGVAEHLYSVILKNNLDYHQATELAHIAVGNLFNVALLDPNFIQKGLFGNPMFCDRVVSRIESVAAVFDEMDKSFEILGAEGVHAREGYTKQFLAVFQRIIGDSNSREHLFDYNDATIASVVGLFNPVILPKIIAIIEKYNGIESLGESYTNALLRILIFYKSFKAMNGHKFFTVDEILKIIDLPTLFTKSDGTINRDYFDAFSLFLSKVNVWNIDHVSMFKLFKNSDFVQLVSSLSNHSDTVNASKFDSIVARMINNSRDETIMRFVYMANKIMNNVHLSRHLKWELLTFVGKNAHREELLEDIIAKADTISSGSTETNKITRLGELYFFLRDNEADFAYNGSEDARYITVDYVLENENMFKKVGDFSRKLTDLKLVCIDDGNSAVTFDEYLLRKDEFLHRDGGSSFLAKGYLEDAILAGYDGKMNDKATGLVISPEQARLYLREIADLDASPFITNAGKIYPDLYRRVVDILGDLERIKSFGDNLGDTLFLQALLISLDAGDTEYKSDVETIVTSRNFPALLDNLLFELRKVVANLVFGKDSPLKLTKQSRSAIAMKLIADEPNNEELLSVALYNFSMNDLQANDSAVEDLMHLGDREFFDMLALISKTPKYFETFIRSFMKNDNCVNYLFDNKFLYIVKTLKQQQIDDFAKELRVARVYATFDDVQKKILYDAMFKNPDIGREAFEFVDDLLNRGFQEEKTNGQVEKDGDIVNNDLVKEKNRQSRELLRLFAFRKNFGIYLSTLDENTIKSRGFDELMTIVDGTVHGKQLYYNTIFTRLNNIQKSTTDNAVVEIIEKIFKKHVNILPPLLQASRMADQTKLPKVFKYIDSALDMPTADNMSTVVAQIYKFRPSEDATSLVYIFGKAGRHPANIGYFRRLFLTKPYRYNSDPRFLASFVNSVSKAQDKTAIISELMASKVLDIAGPEFKTKFWSAVILPQDEGERLLTPKILADSIASLNILKPDQISQDSKKVKEFAVKTALASTTLEPIAVDELVKYTKSGLQVDDNFIENLTLVCRNPAMFRYFTQKIKTPVILELLQNPQILDIFVEHNTVELNEILLKPCFKWGFFRKPLFSKLFDAQRADILRKFATSGAVSPDYRNMIRKSFASNPKISKEFNDLLAHNTKTNSSIAARQAGLAVSPVVTRAFEETRNTVREDETFELVSRPSLVPRVALVDTVAAKPEISQTELFELAKNARTPEECLRLFDLSGSVDLDRRNDFFLVMARYSSLNQDCAARLYNIISDDLKAPLMINMAVNINITEPTRTIEFLRSKLGDVNNEISVVAGVIDDMEHRYRNVHDVPRDIDDQEKSITWVDRIGSRVPRVIEP